MNESEVKNEMERSYSFTAHGLNRMLNTVDDLEFQEKDAAKIIETLRDQMRVVPFSEYLKRYIYLRSGMVGSYRKIPLEEYRDTICDSFQTTGTPVSLKHLTTRVSSRVGSWLQQTEVRRDVVLLLGFGLNMNREDVNDFLTKAIHEHVLDEQEPMEAVCGYCYDHQYGFLKMQQLMQILKEAEQGNDPGELIARNLPAGREDLREAAGADEGLIRRILSQLENRDETGQKARTRKVFQDFYGQAENLIHQDPELREAEQESGRKEKKGSDFSRKYSDIEKVLYASVPKERNGNLIAEVNSSLMAVLTGKRLSRQRISRLMGGTEEPTKYDLETLEFLICTKTKQSLDPRERGYQFVEDMNRILAECGFGGIYPADPYDCFLVMCMLSVDPLGTFSDVMEMSYESRGTEESE